MYYRELFYFLLLFKNSEEKSVKIRCPEYCVCDNFENLRRATCQYKKLYSIELDMPSQVQILDISHNQISELGMNVFLELKLTKLKLLNVSFNKISQIHLYGFNGLDNLKTLDLSFNMVQYFNEQWFLSLGSLQELYLRGNSLQSINYEPRLNFRHLKILDISSSKIDNLDRDLFRNLPNLEVLDISNNFLEYLEVDMVRSLPKLNKLLVEDNSLKCGEVDIKKLRNYSIMHRITYRDSCKVEENSGGTEKFQRMLNLDQTLTDKNGWIYDDDDEINEPKVIEHCPEEKVIVTKGVVEKALLNIIDLNPPMVLLVIFITGIFTGVIIGCACQFQGEMNKYSIDAIDVELPPVVKSIYIYMGSQNIQQQNSTSRPRTRSTGSRKIIREDRDFLLMHEMNLSESTPVPTRKSIS